MARQTPVRVTVGALLDAAWDAFFRRSLAYHRSAERNAVRTLATYREVYAAARRALRRKFPGLPTERYATAFEKCHQLHELVLTLIGQHGDRWLANWSTCHRALARLYIGYRIR